MLMLFKKMKNMIKKNISKAIDCNSDNIQFHLKIINEDNELDNLNEK